MGVRVGPRTRAWRRLDVGWRAGEPHITAWMRRRRNQGRCREDIVGRLLNDGGKSVTARFIPTSHIGRMPAGAQEDISTYIIKGLGSQRGLA
jgi:hypothetical protein